MFFAIFITTFFSILHLLGGFNELDVTNFKSEENPYGINFIFEKLEIGRICCSLNCIEYKKNTSEKVKFSVDSNPELSS
jgi:hypothetical protein